MPLRGTLKHENLFSEEQESKSEFKDWAIDVPAECFGYLLEEWRKKTNNKDDLKEMNKFLEKECSEWAKWAVKI